MNLFKNQLNKRLQVISLLQEDESFQIRLTNVCELILKTLSDGGKILLAGNGGSAAQSEHFATELMGKYKSIRNPLPAYSLCSNSSLLTCIGNDFGFEQVFSRQIYGIGCDKDLFIAFTTSGSSKNIVEALSTSKEMGIKTILVTGYSNSLSDYFADYVINIPSEEVSLIQEAHLSVVHCICEWLDNHMQQNSLNPWNEVLMLGKKGFNFLLLDRDGVINKLKPNGYITNFNEFEFKKDFLENICAVSKVFAGIVIVTNQKGVGKNLMTEDDLKQIHERMVRDIEKVGGRIDKIYYCISPTNDDINRKPNIGMALQIKKDFPNVDFTKSIVVGDSVTDKIFANNIKAKFVHISR